MNQPSVLFEVRDGYALVTLNRPDKLNSFTAEMHARLRESLAAVKARDDIRAVLLTGAGRAFCAGQDLGERVVAPSAPPPDLGQSLGTLYNPLVRTLRTLEKPVVCAVNGVAAGAGANLALALLAVKLAAEDAARVGLIWKCVEDAALMDEARAIAATLASGPTRAYGAIKESLYASPHNTLDAQLNLERDIQRELGRTEDYREGVTAFKEKRPPAYRGR